MFFSSPTSHSSTPMSAAARSVDAQRAPDEEELAIGCECANPALQIDVWRSEAPAQPLQQLS